MVCIKHAVFNVYQCTHTHNGILLSQKKNAGMPLAATWMDLEIIILSEVRKRQISSDITFVESKKMI